MASLKVMLVDDELDFVETVAERLTLRGIEASYFLDGQKALEAMAEAPPDVLVLDLMMPGLGGFEVLKRVDALYSFPVIMLTGRGATRDGIQVMGLGAYDYLMKPIDIEELVGKLRAAAEAGKQKK